MASKSKVSANANLWEWFSILSKGVPGLLMVGVLLFIGNGLIKGCGKFVEVVAARRAPIHNSNLLVQWCAGSGCYKNIIIDSTQLANVEHLVCSRECLYRAFPEEKAKYDSAKIAQEALAQVSQKKKGGKAR